VKIKMYIVFVTGIGMGKRFDDIAELGQYIKKCLDDNPSADVKVHKYI
jgi:hypothetical protein